MTTKRAAILATAVALLSTAATGLAQTTQPRPYKQAPGPYAVEIARYDWHDAKRDRPVPVKAYYPKAGGAGALRGQAAGACPVIVFSHGLGGSREGYEYLGRHWASHGYVSMHLQHIGSDAEVWRAGGDFARNMGAAAMDPRHAIARPLDVRFAIDQLEKLNKDDASPLRGRLDLARIGMAGHSFGAYTTMAVAGQSFGLGRAAPLADPRVKAAIPMSAPVPQRNATKAQRDRAYASVRIPCLHMTGTLDDSPIGDTAATDRRVPFDHIPASNQGGADQYLVVFKDGDHMIFSGRPRLPAGLFPSTQPRTGTEPLGGAPGAGRGPAPFTLPGWTSSGEKDALFQDLIRQSTTAFWDAYFKGDAKAKAWLADGGFTAALGKDGTFERK